MQNWAGWSLKTIARGSWFREVRHAPVLATAVFVFPCVVVSVVRAAIAA
jgi:hypothetical protein